MGWGAEGFDDVAAGDCVTATVGDDDAAATARVAIGVSAIGVGLRVCAVGVDGAVLAGAVLVDMMSLDVNVPVDTVGVGGAVVAGTVGAGVAVLAGAVRVGTSSSVSPGRSSTGCATARRFDQ